MVIRDAIDWPILARNLLTIVGTALAMLGLVGLAFGWVI